ncbi:unnamed protein product [Chironomus riparius]|uniref:Alpha 1,4-glycosyltransferase domain-containing protein n=1 Tax=Chironomus riparius TaxID=315576 RepID=A0A9N9WZ04_9DIPT|nr:unnamed protein product [Chironomus riparius]
MSKNVQKESNFSELSFEKFPIIFKLKNLQNDENILTNKTIQKIFFIETHLESFRKLENPRQACSVESAARMNPETEIYFTFATNSSAVFLENSELLEVLSKFHNINFRFIDPKELSKGTFIEDFFTKDLLAQSQFHVANRANALRILLMSKYGGQYLDLDVISLVSIDAVNLTNYGCVQSKDVVNNAVLNFDVDKGQELLEEYGRHLLTEFRPNDWGANGPAMFSRVLKKFCSTTTFEESTYTKCGEFISLPTDKCYAISYPEYEKFYDENYFNETMSRVKDSFFVHIWNRMEEAGNKNYKLKADSKSAYAELARRNCPNVFKTVDKYF